jgi:twinkle protein
MPAIKPFPNFTVADHNAKIAEAEGAAKFLEASDLTDEIEKRIAEGPGPHGIKLPWQVTHDRFRLGKGLITVLAGENGSGKSTIASQIMVNAAARHKVLLMSLEMQSVDVAELMAKQWCGKDEITLADYEEFALDCAEYLYTFENPAEITTERVLGGCWMAAKMGVELLVLDNLQCVHMSSNIDDERRFISQLHAVAQQTGMHILIVHHIRKSQADQANSKPTKDRVLGAGAITNLSENVLLLWANQDRQTLALQRESGANLSPDQNAMLDAQGDIELTFEKQRFAASHWKIQLFLDNGRLHKEMEMGANCLPERRRVPGVAG